MLMLERKIRFSASELQELQRITGPRFFEPRTVAQLNTLVSISREYWESQGLPQLAEAVERIQIH